MRPDEPQRSSATPAGDALLPIAGADDDNGYGYHPALCPACLTERLYHVEDVPAMRPVRGIDRDGVLHIAGVIDDYDYEGGHDGGLECRACGWTGPEPDSLEWD